jgi:hypothetical protein
VLLHQARHKRLGAKCVDLDRGTPFRERFNECVLSQLAVFVELVGRSETLDSSRHPVGVTETCARQPHTAAEVFANNLAVSANPKRRSSSHRVIDRGVRQHTAPAGENWLSSDHDNQAV